MSGSQSNIPMHRHSARVARRKKRNVLDHLSDPPEHMVVQPEHRAVLLGAIDPGSGGGGCPYSKL